MTQRKLESHLKDFVLIVKSLFSHRQIINPFLERIKSHEYWTEGQKELLCDLIWALTILHKSYRDQDHWGRFFASSEDFHMAVNLMLRELKTENPELLLSAPERRFYNGLRTRFFDQPFTRYQAQVLSRISSTNANFKLRELMSKNLVEHVGKKKGAYLYRLNIK